MLIKQVCSMDLITLSFLGKSWEDPRATPSSQLLSGNLSCLALKVPLQAKVAKMTWKLYKSKTFKKYLCINLTNFSVPTCFTQSQAKIILCLLRVCSKKLKQGGQNKKVLLLENKKIKLRSIWKLNHLQSQKSNKLPMYLIIQTNLKNKR